MVLANQDKHEVFDFVFPQQLHQDYTPEFLPSETNGKSTGSD